MKTGASCWEKDFVEFCANKARGVVSQFTYGRNIYTSPQVRGKIWYVFEYKGEYNVFLDKNCANDKNGYKDLVTAFKIKESAIAFAIRALLVSVGYINRFGLQK
jgi:hypothetical protein